MADRAAVSLDQTASPHPPLPRQQRQRDPPPDLCRDDRLRAAAHRRPRPLRQDLDPPLHRSGRPVPVRTPPPRRHRQTPARQPQQPTMPKLQKSIEPQLCLSFPGQPCALRERVPSAARWVAASIRFAGMLLILFAAASPARADEFATLISALGADSFAEKEQAVMAL